MVAWDRIFKVPTVIVVLFDTERCCERVHRRADEEFLLTSKVRPTQPRRCCDVGGYVESTGTVG